MLNTLYPPVTSAQFTSRLRPEILESERSGFFKYIQAVEKSGPHLLHNLMQQGKRNESDPNGWPAVREVVEAYLRVANSIIEGCSHITGIECFVHNDEENPKGRKVDSNISFGIGNHRLSSERPSTSSSIQPNMSKISPLVQTNASWSRPLTTMIKTASTLDKIARELRRLRGKTKSTTSEEVMRQEDVPK